MNQNQLRALIVPAIVLLVFVGLIRGCARQIARSRAGKVMTTEAANSQPGDAPTSSQRGVPQAKASEYPEGLDAARIQYLVEADARFSEPATARMPKKFEAYDSAIGTLSRAGYIEKDIDGTVKITPTGSLHLDGLRDNGDHYTFTTGRRAFDRIAHIKTLAEDKIQVTVAWHWETNDAGKVVTPQSRVSTGTTVLFAGSGGSWAIAGWPNGLK